MSSCRATNAKLCGCGCGLLYEDAVRKTMHGPSAFNREQAEAQVPVLVVDVGDALAEVQSLRAQLAAARDLLRRARLWVVAAGLDTEWVEPPEWVTQADAMGVLAAQSQPAPAPAFDFIAHLHRQRVFSERTFGPGPRVAGVLDHIRKELVEVEQDPTDVVEWIDVVLLALDGAWRAGHSPEAIAAALEAKQAKNEARTWPDWRTVGQDKAITHVKAEPAPAPRLPPLLAARVEAAKRGFVDAPPEDDSYPGPDDPFAQGDLVDCGLAAPAPQADPWALLETVRERVEGSEAEPEQVLAAIGRDVRAALAARKAGR